MAIDTEAKRWSMLSLASAPPRAIVFNPDTSGLSFIEKATVLQQYGGIDWSLAATTAAITGTIGDGALETEVRDDGGTIIITLSGDTWISDIDPVRQSLIDGLESDQGTKQSAWNIQVRDQLELTAVERTSDTVVTVTIPSTPDYYISTNETITVTIPSEAITVETDDLVASPTITITDETLGVEHIVITAMRSSEILILPEDSDDIILHPELADDISVTS